MSGNITEGNTHNDDEEIQSPLVFQCLACRTIVGDSYSFQCSNEEMSIITLTAASNIRRSQDVYTSKAGLDIGSTYFAFSCANCDQNLGRYYLTTSSDMDDLRERFNFGVENVISYELGKSQHGQMPEPLHKIKDKNLNNSNDGDNNNDDNSKIHGENLHEVIFKIQAVILDHSTRLCKLEQNEIIESKKRRR